MECSFVIRAYNEEQQISCLLEGIHHQTVQVWMWCCWTPVRQMPQQQSRLGMGRR